MLDKPAPEGDVRVWARAYAKLGIKVLPVEYNTKQPIIQKFELATDDPEKVDSLFELGANVAVRTGEVFIVVDIDKKDGNVLDRYQQLAKTVGAFPDTWACNTPNGGLHFYFRLPDEAYVKNSQNKLGTGIDVRGHKGIVLVPGSSIDGRSYSWLKGRAPGEIELAPIPEKLLQAIQSTGPRSRREPGVLKNAVPPDTEEIVGDAIQIAKGWPPAIEGAGGRITTRNLLHKLMDHGCSPGKTVDIMAEHWDDRNSPPWGNELDDYVKSHLRSRDLAIGALRAEAVFEPVEGVEEREPTSTKPKAPRKLFISADEMADLALIAPEPALVADWIDVGALSLWYGESNKGKTFVMLTLAIAIAQGRPWAGNPTIRKSVLYVALEGRVGMRKRMAAARQAFEIPFGLPLAFLDVDVDLAKGRLGVELIIAAAKKHESDMGLPCGLVVIDTLGRALSGADENTSTEMTGIIGRAGEIQTAVGAHVAFVHHPGKTTDKGPRGHSSLLAAVDTAVEIGRNARGDGYIKAIKQRDREMQTLSFKLQGVTAGVAADGDSVRSAVALVGAKANSTRGDLTKRQSQLFAALQAAQDDVVEADPSVSNPWVTVAQWERRAIEDASRDSVTTAGGRPKGYSRQALDGLRRELTEKRWIEKHKDKSMRYRPVTEMPESDGI